MDSMTLSIIVAIIAAVIVIDIHKRQKDRVTNNLHTDNLKQLLTITALDYKYGHAENNGATDHQLVADEIAQLINSYEKAEIGQDIFQKQLDYLLNTLN